MSLSDLASSIARLCLCLDHLAKAKHKYLVVIQHLRWVQTAQAIRSLGYPFLLLRESGLEIARD